MHENRGRYVEMILWFYKYPLLSLCCRVHFRVPLRCGHVTYFIQWTVSPCGKYILVRGCKCAGEVDLASYILAPLIRRAGLRQCWVPERGKHDPTPHPGNRANGVPLFQWKRKSNMLESLKQQKKRVIPKERKRTDKRKHQNKARQILWKVNAIIRP